jgi:hypothetical protein
LIVTFLEKKQSNRNLNYYPTFLKKSKYYFYHLKDGPQSVPQSGIQMLTIFQTSVLANGLTVSSLAAPSSAVTSLGVVVKAGSRFEGHDNLGVGHAIRYTSTLAAGSF